MHQFYEEFYELLKALDEDKSWWFIVTDQGSDTFYLQEFEVETSTARWTQYYKNARRFTSKNAADGYAGKYLGSRAFGVVEHTLS